MSGVNDISGIELSIQIPISEAHTPTLPKSPSSTPKHSHSSSSSQSSIPSHSPPQSPRIESDSSNHKKRRRGLFMSIDKSVVQKDASISGPLPICEKNIHWMLHITGLSLFTHSKWYIKYIPFIFSSWILVACFCPLWYPTYYLNQAEVWTTDMILIFFVYNRFFYLKKYWSSVYFSENIGISRSSNIITMMFYILFQLYWLYFAIIMFNRHSSLTFTIQFGNCIMSGAWFFFFSTAGALYYFICSKLLQRSMAIKLWLTTLKGSVDLVKFYDEYDFHFKIAMNFSRNWNSIIFLGFLLLTIHVPIDLISIIVDGNLYDIPGALIKALALSWYLYCICLLNDYDGLVVSHLYKQRLYSLEEMQMIEQYTSRRRLGLNFYGIQINTSFIMKILLLLLNVIVPAAYSFIKKFVFKKE